MAKGPFKMKSAASGGPMRRNFPSVFKQDKESIQDNTRTPNVRTDIEVSDEQLSRGQIEKLEDVVSQERIREEANEKAKEQQHVLNVANYDKEMRKSRPNAETARKLFKEMQAYRKANPGSI